VPETAKSRRSIWSVVIAGIVAMALFIGLFFLAGALGPIVLGVGLVLGAIYVIACLHYLLWGRWLGDAIREEVEAEEADEKLDNRKSKFE
jgi:cobalamin biosynthesis protein CobD/CbiB